MASPTIFSPTISLPAAITSPPTVQFTPGPGCVDPEDHWVVVTSCYAQAIGQVYSSPDWITCQLTQFGPPQNGPRSCFVPYSAETVVDVETRYYSGCLSGYTGATTLLYTYSDELRSDVQVLCCPTQYDFKIDSDFHGYMEYATERDGVSYTVGYPLPGCEASYITELSGKEIPVQTDINTVGWEKRQEANVPWDYLYDTMYAEVQSYGYTVFYGTHTCYQDCYGWASYYFSGGPEPTFTVGDTVPVTTTPVEETSTSLAEEPPTSIEESSSTGETGQPSSTSDAQTTSSSDAQDSSTITSSTESTPTPAPTPSESIGNLSAPSSSLPSSTTSTVPTGAAAVVTPTRLFLLGLLISLIAL